MSQRNVELVIGRLVTDEVFRRRFVDDRTAVLEEIAEHGLELNSCERRALLALDSGAVAQFAARLDPCIQKADLGAVAPGGHGKPPGHPERSSRREPENEQGEDT